MRGDVIDIFTIMPVRGLTYEQEAYLSGYIKKREDEGKKVYYPPTDTNQKDPIGLDICTSNRSAIERAKKICIYYTPLSEGTKFDTGMALAFGNEFELINKDYARSVEGDAFAELLLRLDEGHNPDVHFVGYNDVFVISPGNMGANPDSGLRSYIKKLRGDGKAVYCTEDTIHGYSELSETDKYYLNMDAIKKSKEVHILWDPTDGDSILYFGVAFASGKPIRIINREHVRPTEGKSFSNVLLALDEMYGNAGGA